VRGALNACIAAKKEGVKEVVAASAGNHAQGVAFAARMLGMRCTIFMPEFSYPNKIEATRNYGANVILAGETYDDANAYALEYARTRGVRMVHAFDDKHVVSGQGTIGFEILSETRGLDYLFVPVGGGGLISGIGTVFKKLSPETKIIGVQTNSYPAFAESFKQGRIIDVVRSYSIADGISVKKPGDLTFKIASEVVDDFVTVSDEEIMRAMFLLLERAKMVAEPAGAASLAAVLSNKMDLKQKRVGVVISGGNVNPLLLARVITQSLRQEGRIVRLIVTIPDRSGSLRTVLECISRVKANIVDLVHLRNEPWIPPAMATVEIVVEVVTGETLEELGRCMENKGFSHRIL
ncbi:MAG: threonine ammonia-lyase, partial [Candidatus Brockarchaeota archaeon]|nr:threonine ammonia-lyase [Candidatus Brockarchaeota archaeon]